MTVDRGLLFLIAYEAHTMGRIYNKMGEPENPDEVVNMLDRMVDQKIRERASQQESEPNSCHRDDNQGGPCSNCMEAKHDL